MSNWDDLDKAIVDPTWYAAGLHHDAFKRLRTEEPVRLCSSDAFRKPFWAVSRYADVRFVLEHSELFSSRLGGSRIPRTDVRLTPEERHQLGFDVRVTHLDPPLHGLYRRPLNKYFSVPAVSKMTADVREIVDEVVAGVADEAEFDVIERVATDVPVLVMARWLGLAEEDLPEIRLAASRMSLSADPRFTVDGDPLKTWTLGAEGLIGSSIELAEERRAHPRDDFASILTQAKIDDDLLSNHELRSWFAALILGGFETTRNAIGVGYWKLLERPDDARAVQEDPKLMMTAFEEIIRWTSPSRHQMRVATQDIELGGVLIRANDWVVPFLSSANRDETVFENPDEFDIRRTPNDHVGFGDGIHKCLGRHLSRLEVVTAVPAMLRAFDHAEMVGEPQWAVDTLSSGLMSLPIRRPVLSRA